ncbi:Beta-1,2-xylosyltransferase [Lachnellula suecica]|uniref:Beta-1,2-xylosyltransferase n=1 Tax=Lachnellula suecica TaxID=602035 RepID=A0A8T9CGQ9_9HELO|nr:Beta-1,2-xylosyltransferase [Lachnellula suecica]
MAYPGPPRRASGLLRYVLLAVGVIGVLYYLRHTAKLAVFNSAHTPVEVGPEHVPGVPTPGPAHPNPNQPIAPTKPANEPAKVIETPAQIATPKPSAKVEGSIQKPPSAEKPATDSIATSNTTHPIDELIQKAEKEFAVVLKKESHDVKAAAAEYRKRRGRHPPPAFDVWFDYAQKNGAVMVEDFFDQIYHDLGPFWGMDPAVLRKESWDFEMTINVRKQKAKSGSDWFWTKIWTKLVGTIEDMLPDLDIPLNAMDEPRIVTPWEEVNRLMEIERSTRNMPPPGDIISNYRNLDDKPEPGIKTRPKNFTATRPFWEVAVRGCHPDSAARKADTMTTFNNTPVISLAHATPHLYKGYVSNYSLSTDFCHQPDLQSLHGMMISPISVSETQVFAPIFGGSKLPTNNEILLPAPMYWSEEERFTGGGSTGAPWHEKENKVIWRGVATGGANSESTWRGFQRHRFVSQTNATKISRAEEWSEIPENWALPSNQYELAAQQEGRLGEWTGEWADTGFVDLFCYRPNPIPEGYKETQGVHCNYTDPYFEVLQGMQMAEQFNRKYLPDIDGNSFSGRYRGFLMSTSLPIKATIFREWHDSRLFPWVHFVPMDNRFMDFWGIMQYFIGYKGKSVTVPGHDAEAEKIASAGQAWADRVLRREDMQIYTLRLLMEFARLGDDRREKLGWVGDLL